MNRIVYKNSSNVHGGLSASQWETLGRLRRLVKQRLGKLGLAPILAKPPSSLPSFHPSTTLPPTPPLSSPLFSLSFPFTPIYLPLSSRVTTSEPFYHNVQKRSAAIQPRRCGCLCHWPDRFGEFFFFLNALHVPSHPKTTEVDTFPPPTYFPMSGGLPSCYLISMGFMIVFSILLLPFLLHFDTFLPVGCDIDKILLRLGSRCRPRRRLQADP